MISIVLEKAYDRSSSQGINLVGSRKDDIKDMNEGDTTSVRLIGQLSIELFVILKLHQESALSLSFLSRSWII